MTSRKPRIASWGDVFRFYFSHWARQPGLATLIVMTMTLGTLADVAMPIFAGTLVDAVGNASRAEGRTQAVHAIIGIAAMGMGGLLLRQLGFWAIVRFTLRMMQDIKSEAFARVQRFSTAWHAESFAGSVVRQVLRGAGAVDMLNDVVMLGVLPTFVVVAGAAVILGVQWPIMGLAVAVGGAAHLAVTTGLAVLWVAPASALSNSWDTRVSGALADAVTCNAVVKAFGAEHREDARLGLVIGKWARRTRRTWMRGTTSFSVQSAALLALQMLVTVTIIWLWWQNRAGAGDVAAVLTTYFVLNGYLQTMGQNVRQLQRSVADMQELVDLHRAPLTITDRPGAPALRVTGGRIDLRNMGFRYGAQGNELFSNLSLTIRAGERVGLVGPSGSGKSTFVRLIQRLHDVTEGSICIDGQNIAGVTQSSLRSQIAIVPQDPALFHRTLAENIAYGSPCATLAEIEQAARLASAHDFITRLPKAYGTLVGERGVKLSGGERQRVAIARAFLADAPILIMDEATSSLDSESEADIQQAMQRLLIGRTAIVIAHRLSTVRSMDRILVFDSGRIVEEGTHDELVRVSGGIYRRLFERQALGLMEAS
jgi:ATP-binding cassette subfamily B protein